MWERSLRESLSLRDGRVGNKQLLRRESEYYGHERCGMDREREREDKQNVK